jgi:hypothetical protein
MYEYEPYKVTKAGGGSYPLCWKFIPPGNSDKVLARLPASLPTPFYFKNLKFVTTNQTEISYDSTATASGITLTLPGGDDGTDYSLHAVYNTPKGWKQVGRVDVMTRSLKTFNVVIVPVEADISVDKTNIETNLNNIYSKYGIRWTVDVNTKFAAENKTGIENIVGTNYQLFAGDAFLSVYSLQQKELNSLFKQYASGVTKYDNKTVYLFALKNSPKNTDGTSISTRGDMPIGYQWGYLFGGVDASTVAHELGHGKLALRHIFDNKCCKDYPKGGTINNLMDYNTTGDTLVCKQWQYMHNKALIKDYFQSDEDAAYPEGLYIASHTGENETCEEYDWLPPFYTYYAPSGLPFSLPQRACEIRNKGKLTNPKQSSDFIVLPDKCLTSFKLEGKIYIAVSTKNEFLGYLPDLCSDETKALKDDHSIPNLEVLNLYDLAAKTQEAIKYLSLEGFSGDYFAKGPLPINDGGVLRCPRCQMVIKECYCGLACVCYIEHSDQRYDCSFNRWFYGKVGIPVIVDGHLVRIENYNKAVDKFPDPLRDQEYFQNQLLDLQGLSLYYVKLGTNPPFTYQDVISNFKKLSKILAKTAPTEEARNIFKAFNKFNTLTNIDEALNRGDYSKALYEAVKQIPLVGSVLKTSQSILTVVYSKAFMTVLYNSADNQIDYLYRNGGTATEISEMEETRNTAQEQLNRLRNENNSLIHNRICTCNK